MFASKNCDPYFGKLNENGTKGDEQGPETDLSNARLTHEGDVFPSPSRFMGLKIAV